MVYDEVAGFPLIDDLPPRDDGDVVAEPLSLVHVVGREQHGRPPCLEIADAGPQGQAHCRVESGCRLVENQQLRAIHHRECNSETPLEATRQVLYGYLGMRAQLEKGNELANTA